MGYRTGQHGPNYLVSAVIFQALASDTRYRQPCDDLTKSEGRYFLFLLVELKDQASKERHLSGLELIYI